MTKRLEKTAYHSLLRIALAVFALLLVFDSGILSESTKQLSSGAQNYLASAVGVKVAVSPNELNVLTARITELEGELANKEREIAVSLNAESAGSSFDSSTFILSIILFILLILIVFNYVLDYLRSRPTTYDVRQRA